MEKTVMIILVGKRKDTAVSVQKVLTGWGHLIKTRLGIHDGTPDAQSDVGLIVLELIGAEDKKDELFRKISLLPDVNAKVVKVGLDDHPAK
ncbi:MAG: hypothetical protein GX442_04535 [Candidatus Riflebacteria bacterium]|nr:hypothetical protein [Candidatus Riflebacteria bacterium]